MSAAYAEPELAKDNTQPLNKTGFTFSPIAHAQTAEIINFLDAYSQLTKEEQTATYKEITEGLSKDNDDAKLRIKQAAMLAIPESKLRDPKLAQEKLDALLADKTLSESNLGLVKLIHAFTADYNLQQQKSLDITKKADKLKSRNKALSKQLNDIKNIEKTMIERNVKANKQ